MTRTTGPFPGDAPRGTALTGCALLALLGACGGTDERPAAAPANAVERLAKPVTGGVVQANPWFVVTVESTGACSGVIYKRNWVITAAHCFPDAWDHDPKDGVITAAEIKAKWPNPGFVQSQGGPNSSGGSNGSSPFKTVKIVKPSGTKWDVGVDAGNNDIAMIELASSYFPEKVAGWKSYYHLNASGVPVLNLDQWSTTLLAPTSHVDNYGYAAGNLRHAVGEVISSEAHMYTAGALNGVGVTEHGDSGGPGFWLGTSVWGPGNVYYTTGIHSGGASDTSTEVSINFNKAWIESVGGT